MHMRTDTKTRPSLVWSIAAGVAITSLTTTTARPSGTSRPNWTAGATGPAGGLARSAMQVAVKTLNAPIDRVLSAFVDCPAGTVATGGGATTANLQVRLVNSAPRVTNGIPTGWEAAMHNPTGVLQPIFFFAVCAPAQ
jgi:hypothetical protein